MGFDPACFAGVVTSGEVTHRHLSQRPDAWWAALGRRCLHFTWAARGAISLEGLGLEVTDDPQQVSSPGWPTHAVGAPVRRVECCGGVLCRAAGWHSIALA